MISQAPQILGSSPALLDVVDAISRAAPLDRPILVIGERGTGKELVAGRLHYLSRRWDGPYIQMNCAALPESLLDAELFGYEPGAFTGAAKARAGRFEAADGGTLFLDEIGTLSMASQERLLRIVEYGTFQRLGSNEVREVDVRLIGATNVDLPSEVAAGRFRADLLDRLSFDVLTLPPLRARTGDVLLLAEHFARAMAGELSEDGGPSEFLGFSAEARAALDTYHWPGNVRELRNVVQRAVYNARDNEGAVHSLVFDPFASPYRPKPLAPQSAQAQTSNGSEKQSDQELASGPFDLREHIAATEIKLLSTALARTKFSQKDAATYCGLGYDQFRHLAKKHGLI